MSNTKIQKYSRLTETDRYKIEALYNKKIPVKEIAKELGFSKVTIYAELKKGCYLHKSALWTDTKKYSAYKAQRKADYLKTSKGPQLKIGNDYEFVEFVEKMIKKGYSPEAILGYIKTHNMNFKTSICRVTLYSYIDKGVIPNVSNKNLLRKGKTKKHNKVKTVKPPRKLEHSIEKRPKEVSERTTFGHWELDTIVGTKTKGQTILAFTERYTRQEILFKSPDKTAVSTVSILNKLEKSIGAKNFKKIFKSITCDNGTEFANTYGMEFSPSGKQRTTVYYCHPYCSSERASNENQNGFVRRFIPKKVPMDLYTTEQLRDIQDFINNYPRGIFNYKTSEEMFTEELKKLGITKKSIYF